MTKWEYLDFDFATDTDDEEPNLDKLGEEGWELISVVSYETRWEYSRLKYIFKRQIDMIQ